MVDCRRCQGGRAVANYARRRSGWHRQERHGARVEGADAREDRQTACCHGVYWRRVSTLFGGPTLLALLSLGIACKGAKEVKQLKPSSLSERVLNSRCGTGYKDARCQSSFCPLACARSSRGTHFPSSTYASRVCVHWNRCGSYSVTRKRSTR